MIYALGALEAYKMLFAIDSQGEGIVQHRIDNTNSSEYTVRQWSLGDKVKALCRI